MSPKRFTMATIALVSVSALALVSLSALWSLCLRSGFCVCALVSVSAFCSLCLRSGLCVCAALWSLCLRSALCVCALVSVSALRSGLCVCALVSVSVLWSCAALSDCSFTLTVQRALNIRRRVTRGRSHVRLLPPLGANSAYTIQPCTSFQSHYIRSHTRSMHSGRMTEIFYVLLQ